MRYAIFSCVALLASLLLGWLLARAIGRRRAFGRGATALLSLVLGLSTMTAVVVIYLLRYAPASSQALQALHGSEDVSVQDTEEGFLFDGPGTDACLVLLPGARVQAEAYAPLMLGLAERGVDCHLVEAPLHMAPLASGRVDAILAREPGRRWVLAGHSLGGVVACSSASWHAGQVEGVVLLASHPAVQLPEGSWLLSIYGSEDAVLERKSYQDARDLWPPDAREVVIEGGNHAGFAYYGTQAGDGVALIPAEDQQEQAVQAIVEAIFAHQGQESAQHVRGGHHGS